jgi:flagellar hook-associated protein 3
MTLRVTPQVTTTFNMRNLARQQQLLLTAQRQISSGQRISRPSDDPLRLRQSLLQEDDFSRFGAHIESVRQGRLQLDQAHTHLLDAERLLARAQQIALEGRQATQTHERQALAQEVDGLLSRLAQLANASSHAGALFAGTALEAVPFPSAGQGQAAYDGAGEETRLVLGDAVAQPSLAPGDAVFGSLQRGATLVEGTTGVAAGSGTDTAIGVREVIVQHLAATIAGTSGMAVGSSTAAQSTVIGTHTLTIEDTSGTGANGTVSLNGGPAVAWTSAETGLAVTGPRGETLLVDTTALAAGFTGDVTVQADGEISVDGGATFVPVLFAANQTLIDSRDGSTVNLDTTGVFQSGTDRAEFLDTADAFQTLQLLRDDLLAANELSSIEAAERLGRRLDDVLRIHDQLLDALGVQSVRLEHLDRLETLYEDRQFQAETSLAETTATDVPAAVVAMEQARLQYQYTIATLTQVSSLSLVDFLR